MSEPIRSDLPAEPQRSGPPATGWGPRLFLGALAVVLVFFWWLLIWSGGVVPHHG